MKALVVMMIALSPLASKAAAPGSKDLPCKQQKIKCDTLNCGNTNPTSTKTATATSGGIHGTK